MLFGALFVLLAIATVVLWARTNPPGERLNLWRIYLAMVATTDTAFLFSPHLLTFLVLFGFTMSVAATHMYNGGLWSDRDYASKTLLVTGLLFLLAAAFASPTVFDVFFISLGLFFTYTSTGQRYWAAINRKIQDVIASVGNR
jgi:hypothetical protein